MSNNYNNQNTPTPDGVLVFDGMGPMSPEVADVLFRAALFIGAPCEGLTVEDLSYPVKVVVAEGGAR